MRRIQIIFFLLIINNAPRALGGGLVDDRLLMSYILNPVVFEGLECLADAVVTVQSTDNCECNDIACFTKKIKSSRPCSIEGCATGALSGGLCIRHGGGKRCSMEGCASGAQSGGLCMKHGRSNLR